LATTLKWLPDKMNFTHQNWTDYREKVTACKYKSIALFSDLSLQLQLSSTLKLK